MLAEIAELRAKLTEQLKPSKLLTKDVLGDALGFAIMEHLGPMALTHGTISPLNAFELGWGAAIKELQK